ncbi:transcription factor bHLH77-like isoform X2 [Raphanus sativus]|uniref:Transcription factor bHLH77-like isoform X2 n=1 Tax=Raphanus sativus TaxID=3726 RepID=A0A9W3BUB3_RAPSA|nr:transcription factor bHLH77-like isoform X2 [Raphanus sativus]
MQSILSRPKITFMLELERAIREKISERMTLLQDLIPGRNQTTEEAIMLNICSPCSDKMSLLRAKTPSRYYSLAKNMPRFSATQLPSSDGFVQPKTWILGK